MAREQGTNTQSVNYEIQKEGTIDARQFVDVFADLLNFTASNYVAEGFPVTVRQDSTFEGDFYKKGWYQFLGGALSDKSNWKIMSGREINKTSDLINDGESGQNPYISFSDIYKGSRLIDYTFTNIPGTYSYDIVLREYLIDNTYYDTRLDANLTLEASNLTFNRFDSIVVNKAGVISVKKGTASATPFPPNIDPNDELLIKTILVTAASTAPLDVNTILVYDENIGNPTEFTATVSLDELIDLESTTEVYSGAKSISFPSAASGPYVNLKAPEPFVYSDYNNLNFWLYIDFDTTPIIILSAYRSNGTKIKHVVLNESNGNLAPIYNSWQLVSISLENFMSASEPSSVGNYIDTFQIAMESSNIPFFIDRIFLQKGADEGISQHNDIPGKDGGDETKGEYYHLSKAEYLKLLAYNPNFTTQEITSGGNYNDLEVTADLLVFTNENAQAILNGVWGKKEFHILNLSTQYDVRINHNSPSVLGNGVPIKLPTNEGNVGIQGTARILFTDAYGYFVADTWGSTYRPEFKGLLEEELLSITPGSTASTRKIIQLRVFRDAQITEMSKSDLNTAYPDAVRGMEVVCPQINKVYLKITNSPTNNWVATTNTDVV